MEGQETGEVDSDPSTVTLTSGGILRRTELVFPTDSDVFSEADDRLGDGTTTTATYIATVPLHFLQNDTENDTVPVSQNFLLKALDGNTILLDASQFALLTGEMGIGIDGTDLSALDESGDILAVSIDEGPHIQVSSANNDIAFSIGNSIPASQLSQLQVPAIKPKRGPGRPRRDESEVGPPIGKGPYTCEICGKEFPKWSQMKRHVKLHSEDKPFACPQCSMSFNVESNLTLHMVTHKTDNLVCPECKKKFARVASLKAHIMLHEKEENLFCPECGDEFSTQAQLNAHGKEHQEDWVKVVQTKMYQCRQCHHCFSRATFLREHMKDHYKVKASLSHKNHKRNIDRSTFIHKCDTCSKCFQKPSQLIRHRRIHTGERPYKCDLCLRAFSQKGSLQIHMSKHNGLKPFICEFCSASFSQKGNLRAHILRVHAIPRSGEQIYKCSECSCGFRKLGSLNAHMSRMHYAAEQKENSDSMDQTDILNVNITAVMPSSQSVLDPNNKHLDGQGDSDILQQALVNSGLSGKEQGSGIRDGLSIVQNNGKTITFSDGTTVITAPAADDSLQKTIPVSRELRQRGYATSFVTLADKDLDGSVRRHFIRQRRVGNIRWHQCSYCSKEFKKPSDLVRHIRTHTHEKPYKCNHCFRSFAVKSTLTAHVRTHTGVKEYTCLDCNKKFSSASSLKVHIRLHTGNRPFSCHHCNKTFRTAGHRKTHTLSHIREIDCDFDIKRKNRAVKLDLATLPAVTLQEPIIMTENGLIQRQVLYVPNEEQPGERPHKCSMCPATFRKSSHLKLHHRTHTGEKPYKCDQCDKCFGSNGILKQHLRTHAGLKTYKCDVCNNHFSTNGSLKRHEAIHNEARPYMCPYCHKTFKTSLNCRKHMKTHRLELALQAAQQDKGDKETSALTSGSLLEINNSTFTTDGLPAELSQAFADQSFTIGSSGQEGNGETNFTQSTLVRTLTEEDLAEAPSLQTQGVITHTLHADASGTITLPALSGQHTLTQESINEIERTLNEQIFGTSDGSLVDGSDTTATLTITAAEPVPHNNSSTTGIPQESNSDQIPDDTDGLVPTTTGNLAQSLATVTVSSPHNQQPLIEELVLASGQQNNPPVGGDKTDSSAGIFEATFGAPGFDNCVFSSITLQGDPLSLDTLTDSTAIATSMATILPSSHTATNNTVTLSSNLNEIRSEGFAEGTTVTLLGENEGDEHEVEHIDVDDNGEDVNDDGGGEDLGHDSAEDEEYEVEDQDIDIEEEEDQRPHKCTICRNAFKKISHLKAHMNSHSGEKLYACNLCEQKCSTSSALKAHIKLHSGEKDFECQVCELRFSTNGSLTRHMVIHSDKRPFKCSICKNAFRTDAMLRRHIKLHEPREKKGDVVTRAAIAEPRGRRRTAVLQLSAEETNVLAQQSIDTVASVSEKVLISSAAEKDRISELRDPQDQFQNEPLFPNQCKYCPKSFRKPSDLVRHVRIHTGERPYQCSYCGKCFTVKSTLDSHWKTHSGEKLCTCHVCERSFATKGSLKVHMRLHTGAKPFKCPMCDMRFRTSGHRKAHLQSHMKDSQHSGKANAFHGVRKRRKLATAERIKEGEEEVVPSTEPLAQITLDASALGNLLPLASSDGLNSATLLTGGSDGTSLVNNLQLQLADSFQITGLDGSLLTTQALQLDESLLQQLQQASNIIIQTNIPNVLPEEPGDNVESTTLNQPSQDSLEDVGSLRYEVHTDESGQIINIQPAGGDVGAGSVIFNVGGDMGMQVIDDTDASLTLPDHPLPSRFRVTDSLKGGRSLIAVNESEKKDKGDDVVVEMDDDFLVFHDCETCGKRFSKPSQLERHNRIHTGERPFECHLCQKRFNQKNALNTHLKSHTGERPFSCPHCDYSFTQKGNLKTHVRRAHRFSSLELTKPTSNPGKSLLKMKQPSMTMCSPDPGNALEQVVCDLFPHMRNASLSDTEDPAKLC